MGALLRRDGWTVQEGFPAGDGWGVTVRGWRTSCLLTPAEPGSWSCLSPPRLMRSLRSIILTHSHLSSSGSKRWNPAHARSVRRVCIVETATSAEDGRGRGVKRSFRPLLFSWELAPPSLLGAMWSLLFALSVSLSCQCYSPGLLHTVGGMAFCSCGTHPTREQRDFPGPLHMENSRKGLYWLGSQAPRRVTGQDNSTL